MPDPTKCTGAGAVPAAPSGPRAARPVPGPGPDPATVDPSPWRTDADPATSLAAGRGARETGGDPPAGRIRVVASDIDGTLVGPDRQVSPRTVQALRSLGRHGVRLVLVTGRPVRWMPEVAGPLGAHGPAICMNGAVVHDLDQDRTVLSHALSPAGVREIVRRLGRRWPAAGFAVETLDGLRCAPGYLPRMDTPDAVVVADLDEVLTTGATVVKLLCRVHGATAADALDPARRCVGDLAEVVHSNPRDTLLEIGPPGVSKAATLAELVASWGVDASEVVAFGDMPNDVPMLDWAGTAYAMADGDPAALHAAGRTAPPCAHDGVAQVLERIFGP